MPLGEPPDRDAHRPTDPPDSVWSAAVCSVLQAALTAVAVLVIYALFFRGIDPEPVSLAVTLHRVFVLGAPVVGIALLVGGGVLLFAGRSRWPLIVGCAVELAICVYYTLLFTGSALNDMAIIVSLFIWSCFAPMPAISLVAALRPSATRYLHERRLSRHAAPDRG